MNINWLLFPGLQLPHVCPVQLSVPTLWSASVHAVDLTIFSQHQQSPAPHHNLQQWQVLVTTSGQKILMKGNITPTLVTLMGGWVHSEDSLSPWSAVHGVKSAAPCCCQRLLLTHSKATPKIAPSQGRTWQTHRQTHATFCSKRQHLSILCM